MYALLLLTWLAVLPLHVSTCAFKEVAIDFLDNVDALGPSLNSPLIIKRGFSDSAKDGDKQIFLNRLGNDTVTLTKDVQYQSRSGAFKSEAVRYTIKEWADSLDGKGTIRYVFSLLSDADHHALDAKLLEFYPIPAQLRRHSLSRFLAMGSKSRGLALHSHGMTWIGLLAGTKDWYVFPPGQNVDQFLHKFHSQKELRNAPGVRRCVQHTSDIVILPYGWFHATFDTSDWTVGFGAQTYPAPDWPASEAGFAASSGNTSDSALPSSEFSSGLLALAARSGHSAAVERMLREKVPYGSALHQASRSGHVEVVNTMLAHKANVNERVGGSPLSFAVAAGRAECVKLLLEHNADPELGVHLIDVAAQNGHSEVVDALVGMGRDVNEKNHIGKTALHSAIYSGHSGLVSHLLSARADPHAVIEAGSARLTPAQLAAHGGHTQIITILEQAQQNQKGWAHLEDL